MTNSKLEKMRDDRARDHANYVYKIAPYKEIDNEYSFRAGFDASTAIHRQQIKKLVEALESIAAINVLPEHLREAVAAINVLPEHLREAVSEYSHQELVECCVTDTELARQALDELKNWSGDE